jgi:putative transposase
MRHEAKEKIALWRLGVLGPLISARLEHGDRHRYLEEAAARLQQQPDGTYVQLSPRTIESWYYAYRHGGFPALFPQDRCRTATINLSQMSPSASKSSDACR